MEYSIGGNHHANSNKDKISVKSPFFLKLERRSETFKSG
jgi:hypothetical protein